MSGYWIYHNFKHVLRSKIIDAPPPSRWVRFWMWLLMGGATWQDLGQQRGKQERADDRRES